MDLLPLDILLDSPTVTVPPTISSLSSDLSITFNWKNIWSNVYSVQVKLTFCASMKNIRSLICSFKSKVSLSFCCFRSLKLASNLVTFDCHCCWLFLKALPSCLSSFRSDKDALNLKSTDCTCFDYIGDDQIFCQILLSIQLFYFIV